MEVYNMSIQTIDRTTLTHLIYNEDYTRKVLPFIKPEYFQGVYLLMFKEIAKYVAKYNSLPTNEALKVEIDSSDRFNPDQYSAAHEILPKLSPTV